MFKEMRRKDKAMTQEACDALLLEAEYGVLGTISQNGYPYLTPLNYVYLNGKIYFHSAKEGEKLDNIDGNSKTSFCVVGDTVLIGEKFDTDYKSVVVFGRTIEVKDEEKKEVLRGLIDKYSPDYIEEGYKYVERSSSTTKVFSIEIDHISGKYQDSSQQKA